VPKPKGPDRYTKLYQINKLSKKWIGRGFRGGLGNGDSSLQAEKKSDDELNKE
jgi:hypothetical protein